MFLKNEPFPFSSKVDTYYDRGEGDLLKEYIENYGA